METYMILHQMQKAGLDMPSWLPDNTIFLSMVGSQAYGTANKESDNDLYGICLPKRHVLFPGLKGVIPGFDRNVESFDQFRAERIIFKNQEYDITIFNIVKIFRLMADANPNAVELLFTSTDCVLHSTAIGQLIKQNRKLFFSKKMLHTFLGYSYAQLNKMGGKKEGKRVKLVEQHGFDTKHAMHLVRLLLELEDVLTTGDLNLRKNSELLKAVRDGQWSQEKIVEFFTQKERYLNELYEKSNLPHTPREKEIKDLLITCLEKHYGPLDDVVNVDKHEIALMKIKEIVDNV